MRNVPGVRKTKSCYAMMWMPGNNAGPLVRKLAKEHPGKVGWLVGPSAMTKTRLRPEIPYALDNDAFTAFRNVEKWSYGKWRDLMEWAKRSKINPLWLLVPDVVMNMEATIDNWNRYFPEVIEFGWPLAFAVQDGMTPKDVPSNADVIFVGGSTFWKWNTMPMWAKEFPRVHVGRVNEIRRLWQCEDAGVESVDGQGWFRDGQHGRRIPQLLQWLKGERPEETPTML